MKYCIFIALFICSISYAAPETMLYYNVFSDVTLNAAATITSTGYIPIKQVKNFGAWIQGVSVAGGVEYYVEYEVSYDATVAHFATPDRALYIWGDNTAAGLTDTTISDENVHIEAFSPTCMGFIIFKVTGGPGNSADTVINMRIMIQ